MTFALRPMRPADLEQVLAIAAASPEAPHWQPSDYAPYLAPDSGNPALIRTALVAISSAAPNEEIRAFAAATLLRIADSAGVQNLAQLDSLAVHPEARRQGLATAVLQALLAWAAQNRAHHFSLEVRAGNAPAIALYQRLGLRIEGRRPRYYRDPPEDALLLGSALPPASIPSVFHHEIG